MRSETIARNYAEALFQLAGREGAEVAWADLIDAVAAAVEASPEVRDLLVSPRVPRATKLKVVGAALAGQPRTFTLFLQSVIKRGRQGLLREIADEYLALVDVKLNRVRAGITLARQPDAATVEALRAALAAATGKEVLATVRVEPGILGGAVIRLGDRVYDGSLRRRLTRLRRALLAG